MFDNTEHRKKVDKGLLQILHLHEPYRNTFMMRNKIAMTHTEEYCIVYNEYENNYIHILWNYYVAVEIHL